MSNNRARLGETILGHCKRIGVHGDSVGGIPIATMPVERPMIFETLSSRALVISKKIQIQLTISECKRNSIDHGQLQALNVGISRLTMDAARAETNRISSNYDECDAFTISPEKSFTAALNSSRFRLPSATS